MTKFSQFLNDDAGAVTIDWVALTAGVLLLGIVVVYAIFNQGVGPLVQQINTTLGNVTVDISKGDGLDCNDFTNCS